MTLRGFAALFGATAMLSLAIAPGWAATEQNAATHHPHRVAVRMREKTSQPEGNAGANRNIVVSVGPQVLAAQRIRALAMAPTG